MNYKDNVNEDDSVRDAANKIMNAHISGDVVIVVGDCTVSYEGRAWKYLTEGRRSIEVKPSGAVQVHDSENVKPATWQPSDAETSFEVNEDDELIIFSERKSPDEILYIRLSNILQSVHYSPAGDYGEVEGTEDEMHEYIINNPESIEEGFNVLEHEKETEYGFIDIYGTDSDGRHSVVEVKRKKATMDAVDQLHRYVENLDLTPKRGILVAPSATESALSLLRENNYEFIELNPIEVLE